MEPYGSHFPSHLSTWSTQDELDYLTDLGSHGAFRPDQRLELLLNYQRCLRLRPKSEKYLDMKRLEQRVQRLTEMEARIQ